MKKSSLVLLLALQFFFYQAQIAIIGHNMINNVPIMNTRIVVKTGGIITKTLNTLSKPDFKLQLEFGKIYQVYFQHPRCPVMFMEVAGNNVPSDRYQYLMTYEMNVEFVNKIDEDID